MPLLMPPGFSSQVTRPPKSLDEFLDSSSYLSQLAQDFLSCDADGNPDPSRNDDQSDLQCPSLPTLEPKDGLLYVSEEEIGVTHPGDPMISFIGSTDATTCHVIILRDPETGATGLAHFGSYDADAIDGLALQVRQCQQRQDEAKPLELYLIGGYNDERKLSNALSLKLLSHFTLSMENFALHLCCIAKFNTRSIRTLSKHSHFGPIAYGAAINLKTGTVFRATFPDRGPGDRLRRLKLSFESSRSEKTRNFYDYQTNTFTVNSFCLRNDCPPENLQNWLDLPDHFYMRHMSTSPKVEPPEFLERSRTAMEDAIDEYRSETKGQIYSRSWKLIDNNWKSVDSST